MGQLFMQYTGNLRWDLAMGVVAATVVTVLLVDQLSNRVRRALLGSAAGSAPPARGHRSVRPAQVLDPDRLVPPFDGYRRRLAMFTAGAAVLVVGSWWYTGVSLRNLLTGLRPQLGEPDAGQLPSVWYVARRLIPFDFATFTPKLDWWNSLVRTALFDTVATGFAAATIGVLLALPLGYLAARTVAPNRVVYQAMRGLLVLIRAVPELVIAVVLVVALGLGLIPGVVALVIGVVGFGGKLFADAIEDVQPGPCEGTVGGDVSGAGGDDGGDAAVRPRLGGSGPVPARHLHPVLHGARDRRRGRGGSVAVELPAGVALRRGRRHPHLCVRGGVRHRAPVGLVAGAVAVRGPWSSGPPDEGPRAMRRRGPSARRTCRSTRRSRCCSGRRCRARRCRRSRCWPGVATLTWCRRWRGWRR
ncbi:MAG: ABC transporter permease subunit [Acidimicrobiales bacterium]